MKPVFNQRDQTEGIIVFYHSDLSIILLPIRNNTLSLQQLKDDGPHSKIQSSPGNHRYKFHQSIDTIRQ